MSPLFTKKPFFPCFNHSLIPPTSKATTGIPKLIASIPTRQKDSGIKEGITTIKAFW